MTQRRNRSFSIRSTLRRAASGLRNFPLFLLTATTAIAIDVFAQGAIFAENTAVVAIGPFQVHLAYAEGVMSISMTLVSLILAGAAAAQKADPRAAQQRRAGWTQTLAVCVLSAPVFYAGSCVALTTQRAEAHAFIGSPAEAADRAILADPQADSMVKQNAAEDLNRAIVPVRPDDMHLVPGVLWIGFLLGLNMLAVRLGWRAKPAKARKQRKPRQSGNVYQLKSA